MIRLALALILIAAAAAAEPTRYRVTITRVVDADTLYAVIHLDGLGIDLAARNFRLACIDAQERWTPDYVAGLVGTDAEAVIDGIDSFGRYIAWVTPEGWTESISHRLFREGQPIYTGSATSAADQAECLRELALDG